MLAGRSRGRVGESPGASLTPSTSATNVEASSWFFREANSINHTPSGYSSMIRVATSRASRDFPVPPVSTAARCSHGLRERDAERHLAQPHTQTRQPCGIGRETVGTEEHRMANHGVLGRTTHRNHVPAAVVAHLVLDVPPARWAERLIEQQRAPGTGVGGSQGSTRDGFERDEVYRLDRPTDS